MEQRKRYGRRTHLLLSAALLVLCVLLCLPACSDMILNPDGSISRPGTMTLDNGTGVPDPTGTGSTAGDMTLTPATGSATSGSMILDPTDDPYAGAAHRLYVDFLSVGKADCILLRMDDRVILIDTGEKADAALIRRTLDGYGIRRIDCLILTHYDNDHIGAAAAVLEGYAVGEVYMPDYVRDSKLYRSMMTAIEAAQSAGTVVRRLHATDAEPDMGYGKLWINATAMEGYEPGKVVGADADNEDTDENNFSLVTAVTFGNIKLIFGGDAEGERMTEYLPLAEARGFTSCTLFKIPHHGASADRGLLEAIRAWKPRYCVICTDAAASVSWAIVTNMKSVGAGRYFTYDGTVCFSTDGNSATIRTRAE